MCYAYLNSLNNYTLIVGKIKFALYRKHIFACRTLLSSLLYSISLLFVFRFSRLQKKLLKELNKRFEEILREDLFVAASVLNPRQKLRVFQPSVAPGLSKPTPEAAVSAVEKLLNEREEVLLGFLTFCSLKATI